MKNLDIEECGLYVIICVKRMRSEIKIYRHELAFIWNKYLWNDMNQVIVIFIVYEHGGQLGTGAENYCYTTLYFFEFWNMWLCWEPPREIPPMTKVMRRGPDRQRWIRPHEIFWICSSIYPKTRICLSYYFVPFTNSSDINRGLPLTTFLWKKST